MSLCPFRKLEATVKPQNMFFTYISTYIVLLVSWLALCTERMSAELSLTRISFRHVRHSVSYKHILSVVTGARLQSNY